MLYFNILIYFFRSTLENTSGGEYHLKLNISKLHENMADKCAGNVFKPITVHEHNWLYITFCTLVQMYKVKIKVIIKQGLLLIYFFILFSRVLQLKDREGEEGEAGGI